RTARHFPRVDEEPRKARRTEQGAAAEQRSQLHRTAAATDRNMIRSLLLLALSLPITGSLRTCPPPQTTSEGAVTATGIISDQDGAIVVEGAFDRVTTDEMGNVYALKGDELMLFDKDGVQFMRNSVKTFGRITQIDAFYSLKPMVFSTEQGMLAVLDNTLSVQGSVIEVTRDFPQVVLAAMSVQNHFWLFDERELSI